MTADEGDWPAQRFAAQRSHLRAVTYRMLGSLSNPEHVAPARPADHERATSYRGRS